MNMRLSDRDIELLEKLSEELNLNKTAVINLALQYLAKKVEKGEM